MALNKVQLKADILAVLNDQRANKTPDETAQALADAIDAYVKTGQVVLPGGACGAGGASGGTYPVT